MGVENDQLILKYKWESKWQMVVEDNVERKGNGRGFILADIKSKPIII